MWSRRNFLGALATSAIASRAHANQPAASTMIMRAIPSTGEKLPVIGIGSWQTFDVDDVAPVQPVIEKFLALGGRVIDSSPMYGRSEAAIGTMLAALRKADPDGPTAWLATKVWTRGKADGIAQMKRSMRKITTRRSPSRFPIPYSAGCDCWCGSPTRARTAVGSGSHVLVRHQPCG